ncbi:MAG: restriction endonuclease subunit S [Acidobacteriota bacterium]|nr:restriction endonuclease subunit S [Acidobacteriota bacterium]
MAMNRHETRTIEELTETLIDYRGKTPVKTKGGIRLITAKVIKGGRILDGENEHIAEEDYTAWMRRGLPQQWDILITTEAPLGEVAILRTNEKIALAQRVILLRGRPNLIDQRYYYHAMKSPFVQGELAARSSGTTVLGIKQSELRQVRIPYVHRQTQRKIAAILSAYDNLIENNTRRIKILEEMAQALYREWFVHFRFPGHEKVKMVPSAIGSIPQGWQVVKLGSVADVNALSIKNDDEPEYINYIDISSVSPGRIDKVEHLAFKDAPGRARRIVRHGDMIWSTVRPNRRSYSLILDPLPDLIVSTGFAVISPRDVPFSYVYQALTTEDFVGYLTNHARGSAYPAVNGGDFEGADFLLPGANVIADFHHVAGDMLIQCQTLIRQNANLRRTRDLLLPKLISGEIDVSNLEIS